MEKFFSISMGQHHIGHSAIKRSVISKGEASVSGIVFMGIYEIVPTLFMILLPLGFLLIKVPLVGLCVLVAIICFCVYTIRYNSLFIPKIRKLDTLSNIVSKKQSEVIQNADVVFVNAQEERVRRECDEENGKQGLQGKPLWISYLTWFYGGQWFITLSQAGCTALGGYLAYKGEITSGMFVTLLMWIGSSLGTINNISHMQRNLAKNMAPLIKYFRFLDYVQDIVIPERPVRIENLLGRIEFRHVDFTYRSRVDKDSLNDDEGGDEDNSNSKESTEIPALRDVSFVLEEGKHYAFVGKSGAGKSTLVGLILRAFDPQAGHVLVDGVDIRMLDFRELRRNIGLVPQDVSLFDGTMRYNITFGMNGSAEKVTNDELDRVAKLSRVSEFSDKLEKGWETMIGERGIKLSGGQRQRVGIARALIKNPHILIFDEATSSLDTENEAKIRESIREASVGKTTIIIAHRLATVRDADRILVFDEGKVVGQGTHEELLQTNEFYQRLVQNQVIMA
jgi:ABC-type multidrug transport system fused ATPase/permease subunit